VQSFFLSKGDVIVRFGQLNEQIYLLLSGDVFLTRNDTFVDKGGEKNSEVHPTGPEGFSIPRQKRQLIKLVSKNIAANTVASTVASTAKLASSDTTDSLDGQGKAILKTVTTRFERAATKSCESSEMYGIQQTGNPIFDSKPMAYANIAMRRSDLQMNRAARVIQRRWRAGNEDRRHRAQQRQSKESLKCKTVSAPAYFGESCLWKPLEEWSSDVQPRYTYTAYCDSRCEVVYIARDAVKDVVDKFSPWLGERLDVFRTAILDTHSNQEKHRDSKAQTETEDWYAMDLVNTDEGLNASHCKTLLKTASWYGARHTGAAAADAYPAATDSRPAMPVLRAQSRKFADYSAGAQQFRRTRSDISGSRRL